MRRRDDDDPTLPPPINRVLPAAALMVLPVGRSFQRNLSRSLRAPGCMAETHRRVDAVYERSRGDPTERVSWR